MEKDNIDELLNKQKEACANAFYKNCAVDSEVESYNRIKNCTSVKIEKRLLPDFKFTPPPPDQKNNVKDLTKPMGHDMNPLQRNFMDSTH